jgi:hypothetical protein
MSPTGAEEEAPREGGTLVEILDELKAIRTDLQK